MTPAPSDREATPRFTPIACTRGDKCGMGALYCEATPCGRVRCWACGSMAVGADDGWAECAACIAHNLTEPLRVLCGRCEDCGAELGGPGKCGDCHGGDDPYDRDMSGGYEP